MRINPILKIGSQGVEVEDLQQKLIKINYLKGDADGYFGKNTERAVLNFQSDNNLKVDGIVGEDTWSVLNKKLNITVEKKLQTIKQGDQNEDVIDLKIKLKRLGYFSDEINNNFDIKTNESVKNFQSDNNLKADGIVGSNTWKVLNGELEKVLPTIIKPLFEGAKGDNVILLQEYLSLLGFYDFKIDGNFNLNTTEAVKSFQKANNLNNTGIVNQETWELLEQKVFNLDKSIRLEILKEGSTGLDVITLQEKLRLVKVYFGSITGSFGPETTEAVKSFQTQNNLPVTGIVDTYTWDLLVSKTSDSFVANTLAEPAMKTLATNSFESTGVLSRPTLRLGDSGQDVKELQQILTELMYYQGPTDGIFGSSTNIAVRKFQTNNRLTSDGIVGRNTWSALIYLYSPLATCGDTLEDSGLDFVGVVIDPAHGGSDPGAVSPQIIEKEKSLQISKYMASRFKELGVPYHMTRENDEDLTYTERINRIKQPFGDVKNAIVVSNHINSGGGEGAEVIYALRNTPQLANKILTNIGSAGQKTRTVYQKSSLVDPSQDYYYIMRDTNNLQVVIVEYGFLDNPNDIVRLQRNWADYAEATVKAITEYMGFIYKSPSLEDSYNVKAGDTLYSIARMFNTTVEAIKSTNNLTSNILSIGQKLTIPGLNQGIPKEGSSYIVKVGDTLYSIARMFNTTVDNIKSTNNLTNNILSIGQELIIPGLETNIPEESGIYIVKAGDTLWSIASINKMTVDEIKKINNLQSNLLTVGQKLTVSLPRQKDYEIYIVKNGDSIWSIANNYNISVTLIKEINELKNSLLEVGQELKIPIK